MREVARRSPSYAPLRVRLQPRRALLGHAGKVHALHWSTDSHHLVSVAQCGKLIVWNAFGATKQLVVPLRSTWVATCAFAPSGRVVASGGMGSVCSIFRVGVC